MIGGGSPTAKGAKGKSESDVSYVDTTDFDGITDPMPSTKALLQAPSKSVPYKKVCILSMIMFPKYGQNTHRGSMWLEMLEVVP